MTTKNYNNILEALKDNRQMVIDYYNEWVELQKVVAFKSATATLKDYMTMMVEWFNEHKATANKACKDKTNACYYIMKAKEAVEQELAKPARRAYFNFRYNEAHRHI